MRKKEYFKWKKEAKKLLKQMQKEKGTLKDWERLVKDNNIHHLIGVMTSKWHKYYRVRADIRYYKSHKKRLRKNYKKSNAYKLRFFK